MAGSLESRHGRRWIPLSAAITALAGAAFAGAHPPGPDLVIVNAAVHTMDAAKPLAEAVAVNGNRIAGVGTSAQIRALAGPATRVIDARGRVVLPGFND